MYKNSCIASVIAILFIAPSCGSDESKKKEENAGKGDTVSTAAKETIKLPAPYETKSQVAFSNVVGWPANKTPTAPAGFTVTKFAAGLNNPRWIYVGPNGDIFVSEATTENSVTAQVKNTISGKSKSGNTSKSANVVLLLRDTNNDGVADFKTTFITGLNQPFGMLIIGNSFYVGNTDGLMQCPYKEGATKITAPGKKIAELPAGGYNNHWTRNLFAAKNGKIYVTVGSGSNVAEHGIENEVRRANILEFNADGSGERVYASGLRNPQGMGYAPGTSTLWTCVNERDELGDDLVPDFFTSVKDGGFYGWPYAYWGQHEDPRMKDKQNADMVKKAIVPDIDLGSHTASLGLAFDENNSFPAPYSGAAFIGQHGSWNRSQLVGYQVGFVPFKSGKPTGSLQPFLTGFIADKANNKVYGRPVGVAFNRSGAMLVADDAGNSIWQVTASKK